MRFTTFLTILLTLISTKRELMKLCGRSISDTWEQESSNYV